MHAVHELQPIVTNVRAVCPLVSLSVARINSASLSQTAEQIKMLFGINTLGGPRNFVLNANPDPPTERGSRLTFKFRDLVISRERLKLQT